MGRLKNFATKVVGLTTTVAASTAACAAAHAAAAVATISGKSAIAASGAKIGAIIVAGNPVGAAVATGVATGMLTGAVIYTLSQKVIDDVVETVVINPIVKILSAPKMIYDAITDANQPTVNEVKPFPHGDAQPRSSYSYKCVASQANPHEPVKVKFIVKNQPTEPKKDKRKNDDDKDPDCRKCIPSTNDDIEELLRLMKELSGLLEEIRFYIKLGVQVNDVKRKELFIKLTDLLETLIHKHGAEFHRNKESIELIPFRVQLVHLVTGQRPPQIFLDKAIQNFFENIMTFFKKYSLESNLNFDANIKGVIYCIQCQLCSREFNYVGQSVNSMKDRGKTHYTVIKTNICHLLHCHLKLVHMREKDINTDSLSNAYKIYLIHDLRDNATSPRAPPSCKRKTDARIRRAWEMFYQWAFKAMYFDGGGSTR